MIRYCFSTRVGDPSTGLMEIGTTSDVSSEQGLRNIASLNHDIAYFPFKCQLNAHNGSKNLKFKILFVQIVSQKTTKTLKRISSGPESPRRLTKNQNRFLCFDIKALRARSFWSQKRRWGVEFRGGQCSLRWISDGRSFLMFFEIVIALGLISILVAGSKL